MHKNPAQTEATRRNLVEAFCQLAKQKPVAKISVKEIASRAGYNRSTFYQYFSDIYELLDYIAAFVFARIRENVTKNIQQQKLEETFVRAFTEVQTEDALYFDTLFQPDNTPFFFRRAKKELSPLLQQKYDLRVNNLRKAYLLDCHLTAIISMIALWVSRGRDLPATELATMIGELSQLVFQQIRCND